MKNKANKNLVSICILSQPKYAAEANLVINKLNSLKITDHFSCMIASKSIKYFKDIDSSWNKIEIDNSAKTWGEEMILMLKEIHSEYIFILLDDFYPIICYLGSDC